MTKPFPVSCPLCGRRNELTSQVTEREPLAGRASSRPRRPAREATPKRGSVALCINCGGFFIFADDRGATRRPTIQEIAELESAPLTAALAQAHTAAMQQLKRGGRA